MKIIVYAISKNEEQFVDRWVDSMKEADEIYVLDTGSTDNTIKKLKEKGVIVKQEIITPWRFDTARNKSLEMIPNNTDICVCTDLDEIFNKGWRIELEKTLKENPTKVSYNYNWSLDKNNNPLISFNISKIHKKDLYKWTHPVHEVLEKTKDFNEKEITNNNIILNHYPDKNKSRSSYLPLLEQSIKEDPEDDRNMHYLGREYMYYQKWNQSIKTLKKHLKLKKATWNDERSTSMRFIGRCYKNIKNNKEANKWYEKAIKEAPYLREPWMEMALFQYEQNNYEKVINYCINALKIKKNPRSYITESFSYDGTVYDLLSISYYKLNDIENALLYINRALDYKPNDNRLINNKNIFLEIYNKL